MNMNINMNMNMNINMIINIFLKGVFSHLSLSGVEVLQTWCLVEFNYSVDLFQHHTKFLVELQSSVVNNIFVLIL